jgi:hypothetical protein
MRTTTIPFARARKARGLSRLVVGFGIAFACATPAGATLAERAKESGCVNRPKLVEGTMYKCETSSGASSYFNVPELAASGGAAPAPRGGNDGAVVPVPAPRNATAGFPRVDPSTQKGRDDVRRRVLMDELAAEEKLLMESRASYADGAPAPLPEERANAEKYRERIARLRQAVLLHERNIDALKKEIAGLK